MLPRLLTFSMAGAGASMSAFNLLIDSLKRFPNDGFYLIVEEQSPEVVAQALIDRIGKTALLEMGNRLNIMQAHRAQAIAQAVDIALANYPDMHHHFFLDTPGMLEVVVVDREPDVQLNEPDAQQFFELLLAKNPKVTVDIATLRMSPKGLAAFAQDVRKVR